MSNQANTCSIFLVGLKLIASLGVTLMCSAAAVQAQPVNYKESPNLGHRFASVQISSYDCRPATPRELVDVVGVKINWAGVERCDGPADYSLYWSLAHQAVVRKTKSPHGEFRLHTQLLAPTAEWRLVNGTPFAIILSETGLTEEYVLRSSTDLYSGTEREILETRVTVRGLQGFGDIAIEFAEKQGAVALLKARSLADGVYMRMTSNPSPPSIVPRRASELQQP